MNRNTIIGLLLIGAIFIIWSSTMQPPEPEQDQTTTEDTTQQKVAEKEKVVPEKTTEPKQAERTPEIVSGGEQAEKAAEFERFGDFSHAASGEQKYYTLETDLIKLKISNEGGRVHSVQLKKYQTYDSLPLILFDSDSARFGLQFSNQTRQMNTTDLYFHPYWPDMRYNGLDSVYIKPGDSVQFAMRMYPNGESSEFDASKYIEYVYTIRGDQYRIPVDVNFINVKDVVTPNMSDAIDFLWEANLRQQEKIVSRWNAPTVYYKWYNDDVDHLSESGDDQEDLETRVKWVSFKQHFFCSSIIADDYFASAPRIAVAQEENSNNPRYLKTMFADVRLPYNRMLDQQSTSFSFFFGPLKYNTLRKYHIGLERQIPLGWSFAPLAWINIYAVIPVFNFLGQFGWNYGIIILILTILLKLLLFPIAYKMYKSSAKMRVLKPEIEEISKKFPKKEDAMKKQQATMALYKKAGVNPLAGCVPMLMQFPILIAMFRFFPSSIELRQQPFLWATDLSSYDAIVSWSQDIPLISQFYGNHISLFTLLMTVSTIIYTRLNNQMMSTGQQMPGMKVMMYLMPIMFLGIFNNYAAALSYYYLLANLITFAQMYVFRWAIDEKKLRKQIELAKKRPVKKSGFQKRLEEAAKKRGYQQPKKRK
ncbi:MAG: membrane protein insertase YidC [Bacteroidales bacterium]|nr:membrane protein insertase YidC [Bacteroidales bacterium]MCF8351698.1 membrane protein insertase YidC [Bacteroidales bacterium]MCF8375368.1 membrane protein insertase YidC [Bacteroidales bacterium]MCF8400224.1 membrane protein insertase YidC [Bacteroidales bacterium]